MCYDECTHLLRLLFIYQRRVLPQLCTVLTDSLKTPLYIVETVETSIFSKSFLRSAKRSSERAGVKCEVRGASLRGGKMRGTVRGRLTGHLALYPTVIKLN